MIERLLFLDLDNTLSPDAHSPIADKVVKQLHEFEQAGWGIVLCSGRPHYYLYGLARQLNFRQQLIVGENGLTVHVGKELPSADYHHFYPSADVVKIIDDIRTQVHQNLRSGLWSGADIWLEPNESATSLFFGDSVQGREILRDFLYRQQNKWQAKVKLIEHHNCFDVLPIQSNKGEGVKFLANKLGISLQHTVAVGDGPNDQEMFDVVGYAISLSPGNHRNVNFETTDIAFALEHIAKLNI